MFFILSFKQQELINQNPNKISEIYSVYDLPAYLSVVSDKIAHAGLKGELDLIIHEVLNFSSMEETENTKRIDKSIIEYASLIKRNVDRGEYSNIQHNINKVKELIEKRNK